MPQCVVVTSSAATKSQKEVTLGDLKLEKEHFKYHREVELAQVSTVIPALTLLMRTRLIFLLGS
jgi:hypothetical protein